MKLAYNPSDRPALTGVSSDNKDIIFDLSGIAIYARGVKFDGKTPTVFKKHTSANTGGYDGLVPAPSYADNATRFLREDGTWVIPDKTTSIHWDNIDGKPNVFNPSQHIHTTDDIKSLTNYTKATELKDLTTSDTLNVALGKLEHKSNLGVTAYNWYKSVTDEDTDEHINKWNEIVDFLNGVTDTTLNGILTNFVRSYGIVGANYARGNWLGFTYATTEHGGKVSGGVISAGTSQYGFQLNGDDDTDNIYFRSYSPTSFTEWRTLIHSGNIGSQRVASAAKLTTPRTIWGQTFDGTGNVSGHAMGLGGYIDFQFSDEINRYGGNLYIQHRGDGSTTGTGGSATGNIVMCKNGGNVLIGTSTDNGYKLDVNGQFRCDAIATGGSSSVSLLNISRVYANTDYIHLFVTGGTNNSRPLVLQNGYGNVGIGVDNPQNKLDVNGTFCVRSTAYCALSSASADAIYYSERTDLGFNIGIGIGTSNNRGIYDNNLGWIFKVDPDNAITIGNGNNVGFNGSVIASGFIKSGSSSAYVLTGDGGHKLISDFATVGSLKYTDTSHITTKVVLDDFLEKYTFKVRTWNGNTAEDQLGTSYPGALNGIILSGGWTAATYGFLLAIDDDPNWFIALRQRGNGTWSAWKRIPMGDGTGASGTWGINITGSSSSCTGNAATATNATSANYSRNLLGRNTSGTDYGATDGNLVFAEWNTYNDSRWYLKAKGYETRVGYANNADTVGGYSASNFIFHQKYSSLSALPSGSTGWYKIATISDLSGSPCIFMVRAYAHSSAIFTVSKGYSISGNITQLQYCSSGNGSYCYILGARLLSDGTVEILLNKPSANNSTYVNISISMYNPNNVKLNSTLTLDSGSPTVIRSMDFSDDAMAARTFVGNLSGTASSATYATSAGNADTVDGYHASSLVKFYLSPMTASAPADSAKSWFTNTMPSSSGAIVYNVPGSEKTIIAGKSSGAYGHMLLLNYDDTYLRILRYYSGSWKTTDWEKISAGYADNANTVDGYHIAVQSSAGTDASTIYFVI